MKKLFLLTLFIAALFSQSCCRVDSQDGKALEEAFLNPPESTKPWVYWYWISDNISKEGITKDLEAMAEVGIGEALIGNVVDPDVQRGNVKVFTEEWWDCIAHAIKEADRLGIKVGMFNCPGWSQSGGPWVKPEQAMRYLSSDEIAVSGPQKLVKQLTDPRPNYELVRIHAFPAPKGETDVLSARKPKATSDNLKNVQALFDGDLKTTATITSYPFTVNIALDEPFEARSLEIFPVDLPMSAAYDFEYQDNDGNWKKILTHNIDRQNIAPAIGAEIFAPVTDAFAPVTARNFRLTFNDRKGVGGPEKGRLGEIKLSAGARLAYSPEKRLGKMSPLPTIHWDTYMWDVPAEPCAPGYAVDETKIVDLTAQVDDKGVLNWDVPEGDWIIVRTGMAPTGTQNGPTTPEGIGYEVDKMSKVYTQAHFDAFIGELLKRIPAEDRKGFRHVVADSYEQGSENWTEGFAEEFQQTYGYDPHPWLPAFTGRIIGSADQTERFLWDMRRLVADRIPTNYVSGLREKCEENGLRMWLENYGHWGFPAEFLSYGGASDDLGGEFWLSAPELGAIECRCASSAAHTYGKPVASAEAFTSHWTFNQMPRDLKMRGDWSWTEGINHFVLHVYIHQPDERKPGMSAWFGTDFNRHSTWFLPAKSWFDYVRRSNALLQEGKHVADIAYFIGEDAPKMIGEKNPALPIGYDYDFINAEVLLRDASVKDGRVVLKSGASYRILALPEQTTMRPEFLAKLKELVKDGATVIGPRPDRSPSMKNYPACDSIVAVWAQELWGDVDGKNVTESKYGKGRVFSGIDLTEAFARMNVVPDVTMPEGFLFTHRKRGTADVYFITNQQQNDRKETIGLRVTGMQPELWDAVTGRMRDLPEYTEKDGQTFIPLEFGPADSWFIVFRDKAKKETGVNFPVKTDVQTIEGPWTVAFDPAWGAPVSTTFATLTDWTANGDDAIKYYSGTATYSKEFDFSGTEGQPYYLDLGQVEAMATVRLNGEELGTLWRYPYSVDVTQYLKPGKNTLEVDIVNAWWNRLVGDKQPGVKPQTWSAYTGWNAQSKLLPAGLIGPVKIKTQQ